MQRAIDQSLCVQLFWSLVGEQRQRRFMLQPYVRVYQCRAAGVCTSISVSYTHHPMHMHAFIHASIYYVLSLSLSLSHTHTHTHILCR